MDDNPRSVSVRDPLSEVTRKERRNLLTVSAVGLFISEAGLVPTKISALGIDFDQADQTKIKQGIALIVAYLVVAFLIYACSDFLAWRYKYTEAVRKSMEESFKLRKERELVPIDSREKEWRDHFREKYLKRGVALYRFATPTSVVRAIFEFLIPLIVGVAAFRSLL